MIKQMMGDIASEGASVQDLWKRRKQAEAREVVEGRLDMSAVMLRDALDHEIHQRHLKAGIFWVAGSEPDPRVT